MAKPVDAKIEISETGPERFDLTVTFDGERFDCGNYISRGAAQQAGKLFVARKEGEQAGRKKSPRRK